VQIPGEGLDVRAADREQGQGPGAAPVGELAQVEGVGLSGQAAVPGQREPLGIREIPAEQGLEKSRASWPPSGTSVDSPDPGGRAARGAKR
jgi:hypothetical protein